MVDDLLQALERDYQIQGRKFLTELRAHLRPLRAYFALNRALSVTSERLRDYIAYRQVEEAAPATMNRELAALRRTFTLAVQSGLLAVAPKFPSLPEYNTRQGFFERDEFEAVVVHLPPYLQDFARFGYLTGWRKGEIISLTWADVDYRGRAIRLRPEASKTGRGRLLGLEGQVWELIERRWAARHMGDRLIPWMFHRNGVGISNFCKAWGLACKRAGLAEKLFHGLRRPAVQTWCGQVSVSG